MTDMNYKILNNNKRIPCLGLGTWKAPPHVVGDVVYNSIKGGYRHIDCAAVYLNQGEVGDALSRCFKEGIVKREELFITSKLWNTCHGAEHVEESLKSTLKLLKLDYLDLYLVHFPVAFEFNGVIDEKTDNPMPTDSNGQLKLGKDPLHKLWPMMEKMVEKGYTKSIGVSNFTIHVLLDLMTYAKIPPAVNQIEIHPYLQRRDLVNICKMFNICVTAYSPLGSGAQSGLMSDPVINSIAKKHNVGPANVLIAWSLKSGYIVIPMSSKVKNSLNNFTSSELQLSKEEMEQINKLERGMVCCDTKEYWNLATCSY